MAQLVNCVPHPVLCALGRRRTIASCAGMANFPWVATVSRRIVMASVLALVWSVITTNTSATVSILPVLFFEDHG